MLIGLLVIGACTRSDQDQTVIEEYAGTYSPDGEVRASVHHYDSPTGGLTQVGLDFTGLGCGAGSASWQEYDLGITLHWVDNETLEVTYPDGKRYRHNASGDWLGCYDRLVRIVMVPLGPTDLPGGPFTDPVKVEYTPSPDVNIDAYTIRYDSPRGGITQVIVEFPDMRGCADSAVTFYDHAVSLQLDWIDSTTLEVRYPEAARFDHPPWGTSTQCVEQNVQVRMQPQSSR